MSMTWTRNLVKAPTELSFEVAKVSTGFRWRSRSTYPFLAYWSFSNSIHTYNIAMLTNFESFVYFSIGRLAQINFFNHFLKHTLFEKIEFLYRVPSGMFRDIEIESPTGKRSPYFVDCLDVVDVMSEGSTYVVLELCDMDLRKFLAMHKRLNDRNLDLVAKCLAEGYSTLNQEGIVHRDIKPGKIWCYLILNLTPRLLFT